MDIPITTRPLRIWSSPENPPGESQNLNLIILFKDIFIDTIQTGSLFTNFGTTGGGHFSVFRTFYP